MSDMVSGTPSPDVGLPRRVDTRRAFRVYVSGRSRNIDPEAKREATTPSASRDSVSGPLPGRDHSPQSSVTVPERVVLRYDRNAGSWRDTATADRGIGDA